MFNKPSPEEMIADKVYKRFVLPGYSEAKEQAEKAEQRALEACTYAFDEKRARLQAERRALEAETKAFDEKRVRQAEELARRKAETENARLMALLEKLQKAR